MRLFGWIGGGNEQRQDAGAGATEPEEKTGEETGGDSGGGNSTSVVEAQETAAIWYGVGLLTRAFMVAEPRPAISALTPEYLASVIRDLVLDGNHYAFVLVGRDGDVILRRVRAPQIIGGPDPRQWYYRGQLPGPTRTVQWEARSAATIHIRILTAPDMPWRGNSPLLKARISTTMLAKVEKAMDAELNAVSGKVLIHPVMPSVGTAARKRSFRQTLATWQGARS